MYPRRVASGDQLMNRKKRFTVGLGFLAGYIYENYSSSIFKSVQEACQEADLNFIGFEGGFSNFPAIEQYNQRKNAVIDLIDKRSLDGMILLAEHASNTMTDEETKRLYRNLEGLPIVCIGRSAKAETCILIDNKRSMGDLVAHLISGHGYRRIAFLSGPDSSQDGKDRFDAYAATLRKHGIEVDERLVVRNGDFYSSGAEAVKILLDERRADFDAIVAANDSMAIFAIEELERRGIRVPDDIAVAGFDDIEAGRQLSPALSTIRQSFYEIGRESVKAMLAILAGEEVPRRIVVPTRLMLRESCGCGDAETLDRILLRGGRPENEKEEAVPRGNAADPALLAEGLAGSMPSLFEKPGLREAVEELARELPRVGDEAGRRKFLKRAGALYRRLFGMKVDLDVVCGLTASFFSVAAEGEAPARRELFRDLREESLILAGLSAHAHPSDQVEQGTLTMPILAYRTELLVNDDFGNLLNLDQLQEIVFMQLPKMQFKRFYVCLYTDASRQEAKVLMQYHAGPDARPASDRTPFPVKQLVPGFMDGGARFAWMAAALFFNETNFGYMLFDVDGLAVEPVYDNLAAMVSGAVNSAMQEKAIHDYAGQLEEKVKERTRQLELATRERADFFNDIAHEIKNPLTLISNYLDSYIAKQGPSEELKVLKAKFEELLEVMVDYLSRDKIERGKIVYRHGQIADFSGIVRNDVILFRESALLKGVLLDDAIEPEVFVAIDPEALERVVANLLHNAIRFTNPGGGVKVSLRRKEDAVLFVVRDTGIGLSPEEAKRIFERYYQVNVDGEAAVGIGAGLDIVKRIMDEVGADIRVASVKGKGSSFSCGFASARAPARVRAPLRRRTPLQARLDAEAVVDHTDRGIVLFVEDNAELLAYLVENTKEVFNVHQAKNGLEALEVLSRIPRPNVIVSDVLMDGMDGHRFFEEVMKDDRYRDVPFIFLSGAAAHADKLEALNRGAVDYISKPFRIDELIAKIRSNLRIQEALKKKNVILLGSQLYQAIEDQLRKNQEGPVDDGPGDLNRLYAKYGISRKEIEVISLLKLGLLHKEIAARLCISIYTVRTHIARIYKKLNVNSPLELFSKLKAL
jgi:two-component system, sensor histidine kinase ChiS